MGTSKHTRRRSAGRRDRGRSIRRRGQRQVEADPAPRRRRRLLAAPAGVQRQGQRERAAAVVVVVCLLGSLHLAWRQPVRRGGDAVAGGSPSAGYLHARILS